MDFFPPAQRYLSNKVRQEMLTALPGAQSLTVSRISILRSSFELNDIVMVDTDWGIDCKHCQIRWSWWGLLAYQRIMLYISINQTEARSNWDGREHLAIIAPLKELLLNPLLPLPVDIQHIALNDLTINAASSDNQHQIKTTANLFADAHPKGFITTCQLNNLNIKYNGNTWLHDGAYAFQAVIGASAQGSLSLQAHLPFLAQEAQLIHLEAHFDPTTYSLTMHNEALRISATMQDQIIDLEAQAPLTKLLALPLSITGDLPVQLTAHLDLAQKCGSAQLKANDIQINNKQICNELSSTITGSLNNGSVSYQTSTSFNQTEILLQGNADNHNALYNGSTSFNGTNIQFDGNANKTNAHITIKGNDYKAQATADYNKNIRMSGVIEHKGTPLLNAYLMHEQDTTQIDLTTTVSSSKQFAELLTAQPLPMIGDGQIQVHAKRTAPHIQAHITLTDSTISHDTFLLPLTSVDATVEYNEQNSTLCTHNAELTFAKGHCTITQAHAQFDRDAQPEQAVLNATIEHLVAHTQGITAQISSELTLEKRNDQQSINGSITLEKISLQPNTIEMLASLPTTERIGSVDAQLNLSLNTLEPITINNGLLNAQIVPQLQLKGTLSKPLLDGKISIEHGTLTLPYKPLILERGVIRFSPATELVPHIDMRGTVAIKQYIITVDAYGPAHAPTVKISASPELTQEEIAALLISGSTNSGLGILAPALITDQLRKMLLSTTSLTKENSVLNTMLKRINYHPQVVQKNGQTTVRGAIEIDINDKLKATIEKDLLQDTHTAVHIDCKIADEIYIKASREEEGDLGAEVEMKFSF